MEHIKLVETCRDEQTIEHAVDWLEKNYPLLRAEWKDASRPTFHIWLQTHYLAVWQEYIKTCT